MQKKRKCYHCHRFYPENSMTICEGHRLCNGCKIFSTIESTEKIEGTNTYKRLYITNENVRECTRCHRAITKELYESNKGLCLRCSDSSIKKCVNCGKYHKIGVHCCDIQSMPMFSKGIFNISNETKAWSAKGYYISRPDVTSRSKSIKPMDTFKTQQVRTIDEDIREDLQYFYEGTALEDNDFDYNYWKDLEVEGEVTFINNPRINTVLQELEYLQDVKVENIIKGKNISKYSDMALTGVKDGKLERMKINIFGKKVVSYESINKFYKEIGFGTTNAQINGHYSYKLSTDIHHKFTGLDANESFASCQKSENSNSYAAGAYDFVTNGCNAPLLIYKEGLTDPIGRILCRLMYDNNGKEYLVVERLYHNGEFGGQHGSDASKGYVHRAIIEDLIKKGFNVVVSPYSAHDASVYAYMITMGMKPGTVVKNLSQPLRLLHNNYGYYSDGGTVVYAKGNASGELWGTDFLNKGYLLSL